MFPEGYFYILSRKHGFALDVYNGETAEDTAIIVWPQKFKDSDNQLWSFEKGRLINKKSKLALDITSSFLKSDKYVAQKTPKPTKQSQEWVYDHGFICSKEFPSLVLDIRGDSPKSGAEVLLYKRKDKDNINQLWQFESYQQFEGSLGLATHTTALDAKKSFGHPELGYGAQVGVPSELTEIPANARIAGLYSKPSYSNEVTTTIEQQAPTPYYESQVPNYPVPAQQVYAFPEPTAGYGQQAPPPMPTPNMYNTYAPPPHQQQQQGNDQYGYPSYPQ